MVCFKKNNNFWTKIRIVKSIQLKGLHSSRPMIDHLKIASISNIQMISCYGVLSMEVEANSHMSARGFLQTCLLVLLHVWLLERAVVCVCAGANWETSTAAAHSAGFVLPVARAALPCLYLSWVHGAPCAQQPPPPRSATTESAMTSDGRLTSIQARNHWWSLKNHHFSQSERRLRYIVEQAPPLPLRTQQPAHSWLRLHASYCNSVSVLSFWAIFNVHQGAAAWWAFTTETLLLCATKKKINCFGKELKQMTYGPPYLWCLNYVRRAEPHLLLSPSPLLCFAQFWDENQSKIVDKWGTNAQHSLNTQRC